MLKMTTEENTFIDPRDGQEYRTVKLKDGKIWMAQNLNFDVGEGCHFYNDDPENEEKYGRLYTWEAAKKACPDGWRLPSDKEWKEMINSSDKELLVYKTLIEGGDSGFSALLGGYRRSDGSFYRVGDFGDYWSSTEKDSSSAWHYYFDRSYSNLNRYNSNKSWGFSCRYIRN